MSCAAAAAAPTSRTARRGSPRRSGSAPKMQGHRLDHPPLSLHWGESVPEAAVRVTTRIGISRAADRTPQVLRSTEPLGLEALSRRRGLLHPGRT